jgi:hypothetical protein
MKTPRTLLISAGLADGLALVFLLFVLLLLFGLPLVACSERSKAAPQEAMVRATCSGCHLFPAPGLLPRGVWRAQIEHMAVLAATLPQGWSLPQGQSLPDFDVEAFVTWYESRAPEQLERERPITRAGPAPLRFERRSVRLGRESGPGVSTVSLVGDLLAVPNMARGSIHLLSWARGPRLIGNAGHPARISAGDLDGDGREDLVIADLGSPLPTDDPIGRVVIGLQRDDGAFEFQTFAAGIGRVADARPIDIDGDGDLDLVVAAFGYLREGGVYLLRNQSTKDSLGFVEFELERVSERTGAVSAIPVHDLQPDTGPGFVVAFAQEHETVSLFLPRGSKGYEERVLYRAPHPAWGTSDLTPVDLDQDGDLDFLLSNGDTLDDGVAFKPYHGLTWLENRGAEGFHPLRIGRLYGAHAAAATDLDGDGDLDIVASGFLPQVELPVPAGSMRLDSVIWFERSEDEWIPWEIEAGHPRHTGITITDLDEDGRPDVVAAINRAWDITPTDTGPSLEVWLNRGAR